MEKHRKDLGQCLRGGSLNGTPINEWLSESAEICGRRLAHFLEWTENERAFIDGVKDRGEINVHLLDATAGLLARIADMPQLHHRCRKVREKMSGRPISI